MSYTVYIKVNDRRTRSAADVSSTTGSQRDRSEWLPISRSFYSESDAQDWALDLDPQWVREVRPEQ